MHQTISQSIEKPFAHIIILSRGWRYTLIFLSLLIALILIWSRWGWLVIAAKGQGVLLSEKGLYEVESRQSGSIKTLFPQKGQKVTQGELLGEIYNPQNELKCEAARLKLISLQHEYQRLKTQIEIEDQALKSALKREIQAYEFSQNQTRREIQALQKDLDAKEQFFQRGLISYNPVRQAKLAIIQKEIDEESIKEKLASLKAEWSKAYRLEELELKEREIEEQKREQAILKAQVAESKIYSPINGILIAFIKNVGDMVQPGEPILVLEEVDPAHPRSFIIYGYFPIETGKKIREGTPVEIEFAHLRVNQYGRMRGVVRQISRYALSTERLEQTVYNSTLIKTLLEDSSALLETIIMPLKDPHHPDEYLWTNHAPPHVALSTGATSILYANVEAIRPLYFALPMPDFKAPPPETTSEAQP